MHLSEIRLEQFRCYRKLRLDVPEIGLRLAGSNASGKTSFIEGIRLLSTLKSARASVERELINWSSNHEFGLPPYALVSGAVARLDSTTMAIDISLSVDPQRASHTRKQIKVDNQARRAIDAVGLLKTVLFEPEDMDLVLGSPTVRRRYLDLALSTLDGTYLRLLSQYNKILEQRNSWLKAARELSSASRRSRLSELEYWDQELINRAAYIIAARIRFLGSLKEPLQDSFSALLGPGYELSLVYAESSQNEASNGNRIEDRVLAQDGIEGQRIVAQWMEQQIEARRNEEFARGVTAVGPHRDDLKVLLDGRDIEAFGSRGQQRLAVVAIKLSEAFAIREATGESPVLLLDDVLSELDTDRQQRLLSRIGEGGGQVIVTATDAALLQVDQLSDLPLFAVESGELIQK